MRGTKEKQWVLISTIKCLSIVTRVKRGRENLWKSQINLQQAKLGTFGTLERDLKGRHVSIDTRDPRKSPT